jgi:hypothetical protein
VDRDGESVLRAAPHQGFGMANFSLIGCLAGTPEGVCPDAVANELQ